MVASKLVRMVPLLIPNPNLAINATLLVLLARIVLTLTAPLALLNS